MGGVTTKSRHGRTSGKLVANIPLLSTPASWVSEILPQESSQRIWLLECLIHLTSYVPSLVFLLDTHLSPTPSIHNNDTHSPFSPPSSPIVNVSTLCIYCILISPFQPNAIVAALSNDVPPPPSPPPRPRRLRVLCNYRQ